MNLKEIWHFGGPFMYVLTLVVLINVTLIGYAAVKSFLKQEVPANGLRTIKGLGVFAIAFGLFGSLMGLFGAFQALEQSKEVIPLPVIMGGLKVGLITPIYGVIIFMISLLAVIILRVRAGKTSAQS